MQAHIVRKIAKSKEVRGLSQDGFTLIELLVVIAIFVVILELATPAFGAMLVKNRIIALDTKLASDLSYARQEAMRLTSQVVVCPFSDMRGCGADWSKGWRIFKDENVNQEFDAGEPELRVINLIEGALDIKLASNQLIVFGPAGFPIIAPESIQVSGVAGTVKYQTVVEISPIGMVSRSPQIATTAK